MGIHEKIMAFLVTRVHLSLPFIFKGDYPLIKITRLRRMYHCGGISGRVGMGWYPGGIVGKKWDPGILDPSRFSAQIRKVEARLGKLAKIRKV